MTTGKTSVLIVDDSADLTSMLALLVGDEADMVCIGQLDCADALLETIVEKKPEVVLLDLTMPGRNPLDAMSEASERFPHTRFIVLSGYDDPERVADAVDRGAWGFVSKHGDIDAILSAVRTVASGKMYLNVAHE